jgi:hypothetical protein
MSVRTRMFRSESLNLSHDKAAHKPSASLKYTNTGHPEVLSLAKTWLEICLVSHESCSDRSGTRFIPTRLVKVTHIRDQVISAHLVTRQEIEQATPYLALSYCWGGQTTCMLSTDNISQFRQALPQVLPKTLFDALSTTLFLGYNYIWIDSLCIIQDSRQDWTQEAASMGSVYRNCECMIAEVGASNVNVGCFFDRQPLSFLSCQISPSMGDGEEGSKKAIHTCPHYHPKPLNTRGWSFQERALSPRTISFESDQISWECLRSCASEEDVCVHEASQWIKGNGFLSGNLKVPFRQLLQPAKDVPDGLIWEWGALSRSTSAAT